MLTVWAWGTDSESLTQYKIWLCTPVAPALWSIDRRIPGAHWLASIATHQDPCAVEDPLSKNKVGCDRAKHFILASMWTCTCTHTPPHTHVHTCTHTYVLKTGTIKISSTQSWTLSFGHFSVYKLRGLRIIFVSKFPLVLKAVPQLA